MRDRFPPLAGVIRTLPFAEVEAAAEVASADSYMHVPVELRRLAQSVPHEVRAGYLCSLLLWQMDQFDARFAATGLAAEFAAHYADSFNRIIDQIFHSTDFAGLDCDSYLKDLWLTRLVMIPAVAQVWWPRSGLSLRHLMRGGAGAIAHCFLRCGGRRPFLEGHTHDPMVAQGFWNACGWEEALRLGGLALSSLRGHRGAFSTAWYFDPAVVEISPRLSFIAELEKQTKARAFRVGTTVSAIANATAKSATRRQLFAEGVYVPTDYCAVWSRADLLAVAGRSRGSRHG